MTAKPQHYCLQWNNYQTHVIELFVQLLEANCLVDVTLSVEGKTINAHRIILSACSSYFQDIFSNAEDSYPVVILVDMRFDDVKSIVEFIYRGELSVSADRVSSVLQVARELKVRGLMEVSSQILELDQESSLSVTSVENPREIEAFEIEHELNQDIQDLEETETDTDFHVDDSEEVLSSTDVDAVQLELPQKVMNSEKDDDEDEERKKKRRRDSNKKNYNEGVMKDALDDLRAGRSLLETSTTHHIPRSTLYFRARSLGVPLTITRQEHSREKVYAAVQSVLSGSSLQQAAQQYKIPKTVLWRRMQKEGNKCATSTHPRRSKLASFSYDTERRQAAIKALESGENLSKVSDQFQIPMTTLFREKTRLVEAGRLPWTCLRKRVSEGYSYKQHRLAEAVAACKEGKMSQATASVTYKVPKTTIWRQIHKRKKNELSRDYCEEFPIVEYHEELIESEEVHECEVDGAAVESSEYSVVEEDNTQIPVTYIDDESDFSEASLIILSANGAQTIALPEHEEQIVVDPKGNEVLDSIETNM